MYLCTISQITPHFPCTTRLYCAVCYFYCQSVFGFYPKTLATSFSSLPWYLILSFHLYIFQCATLSILTFIIINKRLKLTIWWAQMESNHRPHAYQACALTIWAMSPYIRVFSMSYLMSFTLFLMYCFLLLLSKLKYIEK